MPVYKEKLKRERDGRPLLNEAHPIQGFYLVCEDDEHFSMEELIELVSESKQNQAALEALNHLVQEMERDLRILKTTIIKEWCREGTKDIDLSTKLIKDKGLR